MATFSDEQIRQFRALLKPLQSRLDDLDKQQGSLWETSFRKSVESQFGLSFAKEYNVLSLQHLAKLICRSTGWPAGNDPVDIFHTAEKLASHLLKNQTAKSLLRGISKGLTRAAGSSDDFARFCQLVADNPWFDEDDQLVVSALGRCLSALTGEDGRQAKSKLEKLHLLQQKTEGQEAHLLTCRSVGVMLALFESEQGDYQVPNPATFKDLKACLPFMQLQLDVRGKLTIINDQVTIEVGEIKRNLKHYKDAKRQLRQRAKLLQWAIGATLDGPKNFVLIGHLFVPRGEGDGGLPDNEVTNDVSIFTHVL